MRRMIQSEKRTMTAVFLGIVLVLAVLFSSSSVLTAAVLAAGLLAVPTQASASESKSLKIVTTIFPEYDWVKNILGENPGQAEVTMLLDKGVDLHSFQPTAVDILNISSCDVFIYVGGESDEWVEGALKQAANPDQVALNLLDMLGGAVTEEELVEGMQEEEHHHDHEEGEEEHEEGEEDHDHEEGEEDHDHGEAEYDEHVWLSLRNASVLVDGIAQALASADEANAEVYLNNAKNYQEQLSALDAEYQAAVSEAQVSTLVFGDRFPFRYLTDDYGLDYYAAFAGCSAETEASFETVIFLAQKVNELGLTHVMAIEGTDHKIADTIVRSTQDKNQEILTLDSMQSTTGKDIENGVTYLSIMEKNLEVLKEALK